jgi:apurinic endonuclease APN1
MVMTRTIGLHLRLTSTLVSAAQRAQYFGIPIFQCFFMQQNSGHYINPTPEETRNFLSIRHKFGFLYVHSAFWINIARVKHRQHVLLEYEMHLAERLEFTHMIIHPGTTKGSAHRHDGIDAIARVLNRLCNINNTITFVLENTAYAGMSIGSDLGDFALLRLKLDKHDRVKFCIDTAHAHAYGYDILNHEGQEKFIALLKETVGLENVCLIHLNDTGVERGAYTDRHDMLGSGIIGLDALKNFVLNPLLKTIPLIMELPVLPDDQVKNILNIVRQWHL